MVARTGRSMKRFVVVLELVVLELVVLVDGTRPADVLEWVTRGPMERAAQRVSIAVAPSHPVMPTAMR